MDQQILDQAAEKIEQQTAAVKPRTQIPPNDKTVPCSLMRVAAIQRAAGCGIDDPTVLGVVVTYVLHQPKSGPLMRMTGEQIVDAACDMADAVNPDELTMMSDNALARWNAYTVAQQINDSGDDKEGGPEGNLPSSDG